MWTRTLKSTLNIKVPCYLLKNIIPRLAYENQTAYINIRFISEVGMLISDILQIILTLKYKGFFDNQYWKSFQFYYLEVLREI